MEGYSSSELVIENFWKEILKTSSRSKSRYLKYIQLVESAYHLTPYQQGIVLEHLPEYLKGLEDMGRISYQGKYILIK